MVGGCSSANHQLRRSWRRLSPNGRVSLDSTISVIGKTAYFKVVRQKKVLGRLIPMSLVGFFSWTWSGTANTYPDCLQDETNLIDISSGAGDTCARRWARHPGGRSRYLRQNSTAGSDTGREISTTKAREKPGGAGRQAPAGRPSTRQKFYVNQARRQPTISSNKPARFQIPTMCGTPVGCHHAANF